MHIEILFIILSDENSTQSQGSGFKRVSFRYKTRIVQSVIQNMFYAMQWWNGAMIFLTRGKLAPFIISKKLALMQFFRSIIHLYVYFIIYKYYNICIFYLFSYF